MKVKKKERSKRTLHLILPILILLVLKLTYFSPEKKKKHLLICDVDVIPLVFDFKFQQNEANRVLEIENQKDK